MKIMNRNFIQGLWQITRGYWVSEEKWRAGLLLTVIVSLNLGHVYILVLLNEIIHFITHYSTIIKMGRKSIKNQTLNEC